MNFTRYFSKYIYVLLWLGLAALLYQYGGLRRRETVCGVEEQRPKWWFALLVFFPVFYMAVTRGTFADTNAYLHSFYSITATWQDIPRVMAGVEKDPGFALYNLVIKQFIGNDNILYLGSIALIQSLCLVSSFRKYSPSYITSVFLFVASSDYISWMFNGMRQFIAVSLIFAALPLMIERKYVRLFLVILLASSFHRSALIMIPCVIIAQGRAWNWRTILSILFVILAVVFVGEFTEILDTSLEDTQYNNVVSDYTAFGDDGTHPLRVLVYSIPALIAFIYRRRFREEATPLINFCINMSILTAGIYLISMVTSGIYMGRVPIYTSLFSYILLPWELNRLFTGSSRKIAYAVMILLYLAFYLIQVNPLLYPRF